MTDEVMMIALILAAIILVAIILAVLLSGSGRHKDEYDYVDYDEDAEEAEEETKASGHHKKKSRRAQAKEYFSDEKQQRPVSNKRQWKLLLENLNTWEVFSITFYNNIGIGRAENGEEFEKYLRLADDPKVSKVHCEIVRKKDALYLRDMGSRNGTYLNGERIYEPAMIQKDDIIGLGTTKIEIKRVLRERSE